ncbi:MAG: hypothetical protein FD174_3003 [Geobacteraceae bacterium]|nr:MAG: hypothetical protein FD174_3003 [Geobacteraceae bacterium]
MNVTIIPLLLFMVFPAITSAQTTAELIPLVQPEPHFTYCSLLHITTESTLPPKPKPFLGIALSEIKQETPPLPCPENIFVKVDRVARGSAADKAGIREYDIITAINGTPVCREKGDIVSSFRKNIDRQNVGAQVTFDILRGAEALSVSATLKELPTRYQPEADHRRIEACPERPSLLAPALRSTNTRSLFNDILAGLFLRSSAVHNPGQTSDKDPDRLQLPEMTWLLRHPLTSGAVARDLSRQLAAPLHSADWRPDDIVRSAARLLEAEPAITAPQEITFPALLRAMESAKAKAEKALDRLSPAEAALLREKALSSPEDEQWDSIVDLSLKIERRELFNAFVPLLPFFTRDNLALLKQDLIARFGGNTEPILYDAVTPVGRVIVGDAGPDVYREDAALILDLGGDDLYLNNAGGTRPGMPVALVVDWGGNDRYIAGDSFSQGAGVLGGGFLLDLGGNDTFVSPDGSQGAGFWGSGLLYHGDGKGTFNARSFSQGTGQMGIGIIANGKGDSVYNCSLGGQGLGLFAGAGLLIDRGGDDYYQLGGLQPDFRDPLKATVSFGQGFGGGYRAEKDKTGVPGGIGMLIDEAGDDTYVADYFAQGASYYYGIGILHDLAGNDRYFAGRYAQGAGIHSSIGVMIDQQGNDSYYASFGVAQGMGHDYGVGYLEDDHGDDTYWGGQLVQGAATGGGIGILLDLGGGDRYTCNGKGQAYADADDCMGIMIDTEPSRDILSSHRDVVPVRVGVKNPGK